MGLGDYLHKAKEAYANWKAPETEFSENNKKPERNAKYEDPSTGMKSTIPALSEEEFLRKTKEFEAQNIAQEEARVAIEQARTKRIGRNAINASVASNENNSPSAAETEDWPYSWADQKAFNELDEKHGALEEQFKNMDEAQKVNTIMNRMGSDYQLWQGKKQMGMKWHKLPDYMMVNKEKPAA